MRRYVQKILHVSRSKARINADGTEYNKKKGDTMSEHQFKSIYLLGYGDAVCEHRRKTWPKAAVIGLIIAIIAFWAGRASMRSVVTSAYEDGFDAGWREKTTAQEEGK